MPHEARIARDFELRAARGLVTPVRYLATACRGRCDRASREQRGAKAPFALCRRRFARGRHGLRRLPCRQLRARARSRAFLRCEGGVVVGACYGESDAAASRASTSS